MSERSLTEKVFSRYLGEGDYGIDVSTGFPLIVRDNCRGSYTRLCEVFGFFHKSVQFIREISARSRGRNSNERKRK